MKISGLLLVTLVLGVDGVAAAQSAVQASVGGVVPDNLPRPRQEVGLSIGYPKRGILSASTSQYCGDGDVSSYAARHPAVDFVNSGNVSLVLGYWVAKAGTDRPVPTAGPGLGTWYPIGITQIASSAGTADHMVGVNKAPNGPISAMALLSGTLNQLAQNTGFNMPASGPHSYDVHVAMTMCKTVRNPSQVAKYQPTPADIVAALSASAFANADATIAGEQQLTKLTSFDLTVAGSSGAPSVDVTIGKGLTNDLTNDPFYGLALGVLGWKYPAGAPDVKTYLNKLNPQVDSSLTDLGSAYATAPRCRGANVPGVTADGPFWWEPYQMQLTCKALSQFDNGASLAGNLQALLAPTDVPSKQDFEAARQGLAALLIKTALVQQTQIALDSQYAGLAPKDKCFIVGEAYIDKVMGSVPLDLMSPKPAATYVMRHPEPSFALTGDGVYRGSSGDQNTIYGMTSSPGSAMTVALGTLGKAPAVAVTSMALQLNVRGIGCAGHFFCLAPKAPILPPWADAGNG